jgi:hypothetical protein
MYSSQEDLWNMSDRTQMKSAVTRRNLLEYTGLLALSGIFPVRDILAAEHTTDSDTLLNQVLVEMRVTRDFLASWFAGVLEKPEKLEDFYLSRVLAENFTIVRPDGTRLDRDQTLHGFFEKLYGSDPTVIRHENRNMRLILDTGTIAVIGYDEKHVYTDHAVVNALTAIFLKNETAPNGVSWLVVHETHINN